MYVVMALVKYCFQKFYEFYFTKETITCRGLISTDNYPRSTFLKVQYHWIPRGRAMLRIINLDYTLSGFITT